MIEQLIQVICDFRIIQCTFRHRDTLAFKLTVITGRPAVYNDFLEFVVEFDVLFVDFECFNFQFAFADELAC